MAIEKKKQTLSHLTKQYKLNVLGSADAASLNLVGTLAAACVLIVGAILNRIFLKSWTDLNAYLALFTGLVAAICFFGIKIANQWERAVVLRLGKFHSLRGPGPFFIIPIIDTLAQCVDMRIRSTDFSSESTLTKDTVPVNVDAICFWMVWDAKKAILEVENFYLAIILSAQTALRDIMAHTSCPNY